MLNNAWIKLATVSLVGIVISFVILWGIAQFSGYSGMNGANHGYGYQYQSNDSMYMPGTNGNMQGNMNMNGYLPGMNMNGNVQGSMNMNGNMQGMGMNNMQGMGMMNNMQGMNMMDMQGMM